jgi:hypothetical protein
MPTQLQTKPEGSLAAPAQRPIDWVDIWAICVGLAACATAVFIYASSGDGVGVGLTLGSIAGVIYAVLRGISQPQG